MKSRAHDRDEDRGSVKYPAKAFFGRAQRAFRLALLGEVLDHDDLDPTATVLDGLAPYPRDVRRAVEAQAHRFVRLFAAGANVRGNGFMVIRVSEIEDAAPDQFLRPRPQDLRAPAVHLDDAAVLGQEDSFRCRIEQHARPFLVLAQRLPGAFALGDVLYGADDTDGVAGGIPQGLAPAPHHALLAVRPPDAVFAIHRRAGLDDRARVALDVRDIVRMDETQGGIERPVELVNPDAVDPGTSGRTRLRAGSRGPIGNFPPARLPATASGMPPARPARSVAALRTSSPLSFCSPLGAARHILWRSTDDKDSLNLRACARRLTLTTG